MKSTVEDGPYGGDGGSAWTDGGDVHLKGDISQIQIRSGKRVDSIKVMYGDTWGEEHGGDGGSNSNIEFQDGEHIVAVLGTG